MVFVTVVEFSSYSVGLYFLSLNQCEDLGAYVFIYIITISHGVTVSLTKLISFIRG